MTQGDGTGRGRWLQSLAGSVVVAVVGTAYAFAAVGDGQAATLNARVTPPVELVRANILPPGVETVPSREAMATLGWAMWRSPLEQRLLNRFFVEAERRRDRSAGILDAALLQRLGWRDTATTQNLMLRYALGEQFGALIDRGDSLLRRKQLEDNVFRFLGALETIPSMQQRLVQRLKSGAPWRERYLAYMVLGDNAQFRTARLSTVSALLDGGDRMSRPELAPFVSVLVANDAVEQAWRLWRRVGDLPGTGVGLNDRDFHAAHKLHRSSAALTPFDWQLGSGSEFAASVPDYKPSGVSLRWNGQGIPVFLSQRVRLPDGIRPVVTVISGRPASVRTLLEPVLTCAGEDILFAPTAIRGDKVSYAADRRLQCPFAIFHLRGKVTDDPSPDPIEVDAIDLSQG